LNNLKHPRKPTYANDVYNLWPYCSIKGFYLEVTPDAIIGAIRYPFTPLTVTLLLPMERTKVIRTPLGSLTFYYDDEDGHNHQYKSDDRVALLLGQGTRMIDPYGHYNAVIAHVVYESTQNDGINIEIECKFQLLTPARVSDFRHGRALPTLYDHTRANYIPSIGVLSEVSFYKSPVCLVSKKTKILIQCMLKTLLDFHNDFGEKLFRARDVFFKESFYLYTKDGDIVSSIAYLRDAIAVCCHSLHASIIRRPGTMQEILDEYYAPHNAQIVKLIYALSTWRNYMKIISQLDRRVQTDMQISQTNLIIHEKIRILSEQLTDGSGDSKKRYEQYLDENIHWMPDYLAAAFKAEINKLKYASGNNSESQLIAIYLNWLMLLPRPDNISKLEENETTIISRWSESHMLTHHAKEKLLDYLVGWSRVDLYGNRAICLVGAPGVGKSTIAASFAQAAGLSFAKISLAGCDDPALLVGHKRTYVAASPGKIIDTILRLGVRNPVILLDEIDKVAGASVRGSVSSTLIDILDPAQKSMFTDNYMNVPFDLSGVMFICTANNIDDIPQALYDRLDVIYMDDYTIEEKIAIAKQYVLPQLNKFLLQNGKPEMVISDAMLKHIIANYTCEAGVRSIKSILKRCAVRSARYNTSDIDQIFLNNHQFEPIINMDPFLLSPGTVRVLTASSVGGSVLELEVATAGHEDVYTGGVGTMMIDSCKIAKTWCRTHKHIYNIDESIIAEHLHVHVPRQGTNKEGPSAGVAVCLAMLSFYKQIPIPSNIAVTGELSILGKVLAVGGIKSKLLAAVERKIDTIILSEENRHDVEQIEAFNLATLNIYFVNNITEVIKIIFEEKFLTIESLKTISLN
jgi:ATP-dependent Lon protease